MAKEATKARETWRKIDDSDGCTGIICNYCLEDGRVAQIDLLPLGRPLEDHVHEASCRVVVIDKRVEQRIAIEAWKAEPSLAAIDVNQAGNGSVSNDAEA
jgi:hypothetical protein